MYPNETTAIHQTMQIIISLCASSPYNIYKDIPELIFPISVHALNVEEPQVREMGLNMIF